MSNLQVIADEIYGLREAFGAVVCDKDINFDREAGFAMQVLSNNDYSVSVAMGNKQSVRDAITNVAAIGISLNPAKKQAYLVPRDKKICLDISYMGLLDLAIASGSIRWGQAEIVYSNDTFKRNGFDKAPTHEFEEFSKDRGDIIGVYVVVKTCDGDYLTASMTSEQVFEIRNRSSAWKAWVKDKKRCPWVTDEGEMIKKTVIKRAYKTWPKTDRLDKAVHFLNTEGGEGLAELAASDQPASFRSSPTMGAMDALPVEVQNVLRDLAEEVTEIFNNPESGAFIAFDKLEGEKLDGDQKVALWSLLPSNVRTGLKKEGEARRVATTVSPA